MTKYKQNFDSFNGVKQIVNCKEVVFNFRRKHSLAGMDHFYILLQLQKHWEVIFPSRLRQSLEILEHILSLLSVRNQKGHLFYRLGWQIDYMIEHEPKEFFHLSYCLLHHISPYYYYLKLYKNQLYSFNNKSSFAFSNNFLFSINHSKITISTSIIDQ